MVGNIRLMDFLICCLHLDICDRSEKSSMLKILLFSTFKATFFKYMLYKSYVCLYYESKVVGKCLNISANLPDQTKRKESLTGTAPNSRVLERIPN